MELVIKLSEEDYKQVVDKWEINATHVIDAILKGKPLPKGHGRLIDADKVLRRGGYDESYIRQNYIIDADKGVDE